MASNSETDWIVMTTCQVQTLLQIYSLITEFRLLGNSETGEI